MSIQLERYHKYWLFYKYYTMIYFSDNASGGDWHFFTRLTPMYFLALEMIYPYVFYIFTAVILCSILSV